MYLGKFVEEGTIEDIFYHPMHPYSKALLSARPLFSTSAVKERIILKGNVPSPINPPSGCPFHTRYFEKDKHIGCDEVEAKKIKIEGDNKHHYIYCLPYKSGAEPPKSWQFVSDNIDNLLDTYSELGKEEISIED